MEHFKPSTPRGLDSIPEIQKQIIVEMDEEDKDSGFGDYGTESSDSSNSSSNEKESVED